VSQPQYVVVRDPLFTFMLSEYNKGFYIAPAGGYVIDGNGNQINMMARSVQITSLDQKSATIIQTGVFMIQQQSAIKRIVLRDTVGDYRNCGIVPSDSGWSLSDISFDAYTDGVVLQQPGYYILVIQITVSSGGIFTKQ
jgi:hypothetical protein